LLAILAVILFKPPFYLYFKRVFTVLLFPLSVSIFIPFANRGNVLYSFNIFHYTISATDNGLAIFITVLAKSFISVMVLAALVTSSGDIEILHGLRKIWFPKTIVSIIFLMYRYFFLIRDQSRVGQLAISSRVFKRSYHTVNKRLAFLAGSLFIKSFDRAENVYKSMESRGFNGDFYVLKQKQKTAVTDIIITTFFIMSFSAVKCIELLELVV
jgi:cobalt/nickel transport system permease protein